MTNSYYISTDKLKLDVNLVVHFLNNTSYWAKNRSKSTIEKSIANSLCFGVYTKESQQVGFARVITDYAVFAWILDLFITEAHQGKGLGIQLMQKITSHEELNQLKRWGLATI